MLPKEEWTKPEDVCVPIASGVLSQLTIEQDTPYLSSVIKEIEAEMKEREDLESMVVQKRKNNAKESH